MFALTLKKMIYSMHNFKVSSVTLFAFNQTRLCDFYFSNSRSTKWKLGTANMIHSISIGVGKYAVAF